MEAEEMVLKWKEPKTCGEKLYINENIAVIFLEGWLLKLNRVVLNCRFVLLGNQTLVMVR